MSTTPSSALRPGTPPPTTGFAANLGAATARKDRLGALKARVPKPGEASFFFYDAHFHNEAVKILPGEYFVYDEDIIIMTTLGSCIATCLWDRNARIGGMNHFMLPDNGGGTSDSGRYGSFAMELLINEMLKRGASRMTLEAKVFGGGAVISGMSSLNVGERNTTFVMDYLKTERIPIVSKDVMDIYPRKVCFFPQSGKAMVKRLAAANPDAIVAQDRLAAQKAAVPAAAGGSIDLF
ncbi:chemoreceptor glutamine deamidase CheD [Aquabacterium sp.]|uniref:chemoreceptor glutamine deamidase CheD n=1 Tax=Aquabacterium sp. TaxID=1872578 RepID=UPI0025BFDAA6|nr:chemoreceptor glutamine deamidase CheD [Aquabacterium sp.]